MRDKKGDTRTQWAYQTLKDKIMYDELPHDRPYLEQELADDLGISRTPVREAALRLQEEGFVTIRPRLGIQVRPISVDDMAEIYDILTELEPYAASRLASRKLGLIEEKKLEKTVSAMEEALERKDRLAWAASDRVFHETLMELAGNKRLLRIVSTLWDQVHRVRMATLWLRQSLGRSNDDHRKLFELIRDGDIQGAEHLHRRHRAHAKKELVSLLQEHGMDTV